MEQRDVLIAIAALAMSVAGFSSVVVTFRPGSGPLAAADHLRLMTLLQFSLGTAFLCLVPFVLHDWGYRDASLWQLCSIVTVVLAAPTTVTFICNIPKVWHVLSARLVVLLTAITVVVLALQVSNALGRPWPTRFGSFLVALVWGVTNASFSFYRIVFNRPLEAPPAR